MGYQLEKHLNFWLKETHIIIFPGHTVETLKGRQQNILFCWQFMTLIIIADLSLCTFWEIPHLSRSTGLWSTCPPCTWHLRRCRSECNRKDSRRSRSRLSACGEVNSNRVWLVPVTINNASIVQIPIWLWSVHAWLHVSFDRGKIKKVVRGRWDGNVNV